jgi:hypothetical protein
MVSEVEEKLTICQEEQAAAAVANPPAGFVIHLLAIKYVTHAHPISSSWDCWPEPKK